MIKGPMRLFLIILSQFLSGSVWFAANAAFQGRGWLLSGVQAGFITGTLIFAFLNLSDRVSPARLFFTCSLAGSLFNYGGTFLDGSMLLMFRFFCGICLAGIYPVGMKIAASWYPDTLGKALGFLVGALVLASGFPYLIRVFSWQGDPGLILSVTSALCLAGGTIQLLLVGDGPALPRGSALDMSVIRQAFSHPGFRAASLGYFGHMWELYAVWAAIPLLAAALVPEFADLTAFAFFGAGFLGCGLGGLLSQKLGSRAIARWALSGSGICCLISPFLFDLPKPAALGVLFFWGLTVAADSPQFSSLNARYAPRAYVGSALTIVNCIGFMITIFTIELINIWIGHWGIRFAFLPLAAGPVFGWYCMGRSGLTGRTG